MFHHILVPLDGSAYSERALPYAEGIAKLTGARISLVIALTRLSLSEAPELARLDQMSRERAGLYLGKRAEAVRAAGVADVQTEARFGEPAELVTDVARATGADLIVMSSHGMGAGHRYALGSVAMKVLTSAPCPVFMVRIQEENRA